VHARANAKGSKKTFAGEKSTLKKDNTAKRCQFDLFDDIFCI